MTNASVVIAKPGLYLWAHLKRYCELVSAKCGEWVRSTESDRKHHEEKAISILRSGIAHADEREWAERYLCGMAKPDEDSFMSDRLAQS